MNTAVQHLQMRLALLDIQQLEDIADRIEEGASPDVMEVLAQSVDSINERQGIDVEPLDVLAVESYQKRNELALEGISDSLSRLWNAIYVSIGDTVQKVKNSFFDALVGYEERIKDLKQLRAELSNKDPKAEFKVTSISQARNLVGSDGVFDINNAAKGLDNFDSFFTELSKACAASNAALTAIMKGEDGKIVPRENPLLEIALDLTTVSKHATEKSKDYLGHTFGGKKVSVSVPLDMKVTIAALNGVEFKSSNAKVDGVKFSKETVTVGDAIKAIDACIKVLQSQDANYAIEEKLMKSLEELGDKAMKFKMSPGMAFVTGAKEGAIVGVKAGLVGGVVTAATLAALGASPLFILAAAATLAGKTVARTTVSGAVGGLIANETDSALVGTLYGTAAGVIAFTSGPSGAFQSLIGAAVGAIKTLESNENKDKETEEIKDQALLNKVMVEYSAVLKLVTRALNESLILSEQVSRTHVMILEDSVVALTNIARAALKAEVSA